MPNEKGAELKSFQLNQKEKTFFYAKRKKIHKLRKIGKNDLPSELNCR